MSDTTLSVLEIEGTTVRGLWPAFTAETRDYVLLVKADGPIDVTAHPTNADAKVTLQVEDASGSLWGGFIGENGGVGGGLVTVDVSDGTALRVFVKAPEGASDVYEVLVMDSIM